jgi:hypothetical protein
MVTRRYGDGETRRKVEEAAGRERIADQAGTEGGSAHYDEEGKNREHQASDRPRLRAS